MPWIAPTNLTTPSAHSWPFEQFEREFEREESAGDTPSYRLGEVVSSCRSVAVGFSREKADRTILFRLFDCSLNSTSRCASTST